MNRDELKANVGKTVKTPQGYGKLERVWHKFSYVFFEQGGQGDTVAGNSVKVDNDKIEAVVTLGDRIDELVERFGDSTLGIFVLEGAPKKALDAKGTTEIGGKMICDWPRYQEIDKKEAEIINRLR
jgi:hypothetical protein